MNNKKSNLFGMSTVKVALIAASFMFSSGAYISASAKGLDRLYFGEKKSEQKHNVESRHTEVVEAEDADDRTSPYIVSVNASAGSDPHMMHKSWSTTYI